MSAIRQSSDIWIAGSEWKKIESYNDLKYSLDQFNVGLEAGTGLVGFRFHHDPGYDENLINWFADRGQIVAYRCGKRHYQIAFSKGLVSLNLGTIFDNMSENSEWRKEYVKLFWDQNQNLSYRTNNLLETAEQNPMFEYSKDNAKNFTKNREILRSMLNNFPL